MPNSSPTRCYIARLEAGAVLPTATARPGDELVLIVEVAPARHCRRLAVDFLRGADLRDCWEQTLSPSAELAVLGYRLRWRDRAGASTRLTCRVRLDGRIIGSPTVLLTPGADSQGRFDAPPASAMSEPTRLAFLDAFGRLLDRRPENGHSDRVPSSDGG
jgi:hypothetical protein